jgi:hypothetical protein
VITKILGGAAPARARADGVLYTRPEQKARQPHASKESVSELVKTHQRTVGG